MLKIFLIIFIILISLILCKKYLPEEYGTLKKVIKVVIIIWIVVPLFLIIFLILLSIFINYKINGFIDSLSVYSEGVNLWSYCQNLVYLIWICS